MKLRSASTFVAVLVIASLGGLAPASAAEEQRGKVTPYLSPRTERTVPPGTRSQPSPARRSAAAPSGAPLAATLGNNFQALDDAGTSIPPDTHGAAGPDHLMTVHNTEFRVQDKTGVEGARMTIDDFWLTDPGDAFDPKVVFDPLSGRFVVVALAFAQSPDSMILIAVSMTSSPLPFPTDVDDGNWYFYSFSGNVPAVPVDVWADYPGVGYNKNWVVITNNLFTADGSNDFMGVDVLAIEKADLYAGPSGASLTSTRFLRDSSEAFTLAPTATFDASESNVYLVQDFGNDGATGFLSMDRITGTAAAPSYEAVGMPSETGVEWSFSPGVNNFAPQLGSGTGIMANDSRMQNCVMRNGSIWCTHTVFLPEGAPTRSSVQWWELDPTGAVVQRGMIDDSDGMGDQNFFAFPSIAVNASDDALLGYSRFSSAQYASANYAFRASGDAARTFGADTVLKAGEDVYTKDFSTGRVRWGDYSATVVDPSNDADFWTIQEYAATGNEWGTWWGQVLGDPTVYLSSSSISVKENGGFANVIVRRSGDTTDPFKVTLTTSDGSATALAPDYTDSDQTVSFATGEDSQTVQVPIVNDSTREGPETISVEISNPTDPDGNPTPVVLGSRTTATINIYASDQRPDEWIKVSGGSYLGSNVYDPPTVQKRSTSAPQGKTKTFFVTLQNDGQVTNAFRIRGTSAPSGSQITYRNGKTGAVLSSSFRSSSGLYVALAAGGTFLVRIDVKILSTARDGQIKSFYIRSWWTSTTKDVTTYDKVTGAVKVT